MSITVAHRPHGRVPWLLIVVLLAIAATATVVVLLTVGSSGTSPATGGAQTLDAAVTQQAPAAVPAAPAASRKYCRAPWATRAALAVVLPAPATAKYCRAPWAAGGAESSDR